MERHVVLIVDDNPEDRLAVRLYLEESRRCSYEFIEASSGAEGVDAALKHKPDCILLDQRLPDCDGLDVLQKLCDGKGFITCCIVLMTGFHDDQVITAAIRAGAQDYIDKAKLSPALLAQTLRAAISRFRLLNLQRKLEARYSAIVNDSNDAIVSLDIAGAIETWNAGAEAIFGWWAEEAVGQSIEKLAVPPEGPLVFREAMTKLAAGESVRCELLCMAKSGRRLDASITMTPLFESGQAVGVSMIARDVTERKQAEKHRIFVAHEIAHRSKNLMSIIQSMARLTARSSTTMAQFNERLAQRIDALASSQDLLLNEDWVGAPVAELVRAQLAPFIEIDGVRVSAEGPLLLLSPEATQSIGLALHELATNAIKYGALSVPSGKIAIRWRVDIENDEAKRFHMNWRESGGPPVCPPKQRGFGYMVVEKMVGQSLKGEVNVDFAPSGLTWSVSIPAALTHSG